MWTRGGNSVWNPAVGVSPPDVDGLVDAIRARLPDVVVVDSVTGGASDSGAADVGRGDAERKKR